MPALFLPWFVTAGVDRKGNVPDGLFVSRSFVFIRKWSLWGRTLCEADGRDPGVEGGGVWLQVEGLRVGLGTLLCNEVQLGAVTRLQHVPKGKTGIVLFRAWR